MTRVLFTAGIGTLVIARGTTSSRMAVGVFLIDTWSLGVKDAFFRPMDAEAFDTLQGTVEETGSAEVDPAYARKLLRDVTTWAASNGFAPHRDFSAVEKLFGDVDAGACDATFTFGHEGQVNHVPGPSESPAQVVHRAMIAGRALEEQETAEI